MKRIILCLLPILFFAACSHKDVTASNPEIVTLPNESTTPTKIETSAPSTVQVELKAIHADQIHGVMHFTQEEEKVKAETLMEGLKPGPYIIHLSNQGHCRKIHLPKKHKDLAEFVADSKGVVKETIVLNGVSTNDLIGKSIVVHTKDKKPKLISCGVVEKL